MCPLWNAAFNCHRLSSALSVALTTSSTLSLESPLPLLAEEVVLIGLVSRGDKMSVSKPKYDFRVLAWLLGNKPLYISLSAAALAAGAFFFSLPHFISGPYQVIH